MAEAGVAQVEDGGGLIVWSVYDLRCNGRRDPHVRDDAPVLSWRLGSDREGASQQAFRVVVTSIEDGACCWDTGKVASLANEVVYAGSPLRPGHTYVWYVCVWDDSGERADAAPGCFVCDGLSTDTDDASVDATDERRGFIWTADEALNERLEDFLRDVVDGNGPWRDIAGIVAVDGDMRRLRIGDDAISPEYRDLGFVQATLKTVTGLLVVRWDRDGSSVRLRACLPPGTRAELVVGGSHREVPSGIHELAERT